MKKLQTPILAEGEVTGHFHALTDDKVEVFEQDTGERSFKLNTKTKLTHQEHHVIELPVDVNTSDVVREYNPLTEQINKVAD